MEPTIVLGLLIALAVAAPVWGFDSRDHLRSREDELAARGVSWADLVGSRRALPFASAVPKTGHEWLRGDDRGLRARAKQGSRPRWIGL